MDVIKYQKDDDGRVIENCGKTIFPRAHDDPQRAQSRNSLGRVFLKNGDTFVVKLVVNGVDYVAYAEGVVNTDKLCAVFVRVRSEADVSEPAPPQMVEEIV